MIGTVTLTEFLLARIAEDGAVAQAEMAPVPDRKPWSFAWSDGLLCVDPARLLAECEAKRRIVELHRDWPVLVERPTEFAPSFGADLTLTEQVTYRASRQIAWMTEQEYRNRFGDEPPTGPIIRALALPYSDHPDYLDEWQP